MESTMTTQPEKTELRQLTADELDDVGGAFTVKMFGYQLDVLLDDSNRLHVWVGTYKSDGSAHSVRVI
jgi:hypothetical protein